MESKKKTTKLVVSLLALSLMAAFVTVSKSAPMGTAFTYQGRLMDANGPADGQYDFEFRLFAHPKLLTENRSLKQRLEIMETRIDERRFTITKEVQ